MAQVTRRDENEAAAAGDDPLAAQDIVVAKPAGKKGKNAPPAAAEDAPDVEPRDGRLAAAGERRHGFFTLYKSGQGYWTRMGTAIAAVLLGLLITTQLYRYVPVLLSLEGRTATRVAIGVAAGFAIGYTLLAWYLTNKPANADFLISTDSEMKKVNWTSRRELIGSTKVVIVFMLLIAVFLFACDLIFHTFFWLIGVLKVPPPFLGGH
jgi:preprotein translocase subunit SecE